MNDGGPIDAVLPAAGRLDVAFAAEARAEVKALVRIGGQTLLERTVRAVRESGLVRRIAVVGPEETWQVAQAAGADAVLPERSDGPDNVLAGLEWTLGQTDPPRRVLILTTDLPFATGEAIRKLLAACPDDAQVCVQAFSAASFDGQFAGAPHVYVKLGDGQYTMGCGFVVDPAALLEHRGRIQSIFDARKSQVRMAALLGPRFVWRWVTRRLTLDDIRDRCSSLLGVRGAVIRDGAPELAFDIDEPAELAYARKALEPSE